MNFLWLDCETTGLSEKKQDIIQLACIPVINGVEQEPFNEFCQPTNYNTIEQEALDIHGITVEQLKTFQTPEEMIEKFVQYVKSFGVKFTIAGYNVPFDKRFLSATFQKLDRTRDFFSMFTINVHDTLRRAKDVKHLIASKSLKLSALAELYGIEINAHDALSDISATIKVDEIISGLIGEDNTIYKPTINVDDIKINVGFSEMAQLHVHSQYNMVDGIPLPTEWYKWAAENNVPGISIVDQGSAISLFYSIRNEENTIAVSGTGLNVIWEDDDEPFALNAWATNKLGYDALVRLSSMGYDAAREINGISTPILTLNQVLSETCGVGIVFGSADIHGAIGKAVQAGDAELAEKRFVDLQKRLSPERFYVEFNPVDITRVYDSKVGLRSVKTNELVTDGNLNKAYNLFLAKMVDKHGANCIPVSGASFIDPADKLLQDCLSKNAHADNMHYSDNESYHIKKADQVFKELKVHLGDWLTEQRFNSWVENTLDIVERAKGMEIKHEYHMPEIEIPDYIKAKTSDYDMQTYYVMMEKIKRHGRWKDDPVYIERFKRELDVIMKNEAMNFIPYFLVYEDISRFSRDIGCLQSIGRGSAGGCLISYYLQIIHVDPIEADLPFERFLSHARIKAGSWPDIDMDISRTARPQVMKYLKDKYRLGFAQISTLSTMKTKNAIKDAMMAVYGRNRRDFEIDALCKTIDDSPQGVAEKDFLYGYTDKEGEYHEGEFERNEMLQNFFETYPDVKELVDKMLGIVRGWSRHASAFVISTLELRDGRMPTLTMHDNGMGEDIHVTQYDGKMCEMTNLVKADILGLNTMSMVTDCVNLVKDKVDYLKPDENGMALIYRLPEDEKVYTDFCLKKTDSSFQFNTDVVKNAVQQFMPTERGHLGVMTALLRPGAMDMEMEPGVSATQWYMDVRMGKRKPKYIHDDLKEYLEETYGVCCVASDTKVLTDRGQVDISDIKPFDKVLTEDGSFQNVLAKFDNGIKDTFRVRLSHGEELVCTSDHKVLTDRGWIEAQNLTKKHLVKSFWTQEERYDIGDDRDWLVGLLLADGNLCSSSYDIACASKENADIIVEIATKEFGIEGGFSEYRGRCWYANLRQMNCNNGYFNKKYKENNIKLLAKELGLHNLRCKDKFLPESYTLSMLAGFFDGYGCTQNGLIRLSNKHLAYDIYKALDSFRIESSYYEDNGVYVVCVRNLSKLPLKFDHIKKVNYSINVPRYYINEYVGVKRDLGNIRQHFSSKYSDTPISKNICEKIVSLEGKHTKWSNVISIKDNGKAKVFDISVENNHSFLAGGNIVHNCYQEQVMRILVNICGYTLEETDRIRDAIAKKKHGVMMSAFDRIREATASRGWTSEQSDALCNTIQAFSRYSFNRSHSHAYAELGYITMYLKHHHPLEWWAAVLNNEGKEDKIRKFIALLGNIIKPPSMKTPSDKFVVKGAHIIAPISAIKGVGPAAVSELVLKGPFNDLEDYVDRVEHRKVNKGVVEAIVKARAADCMMDETLVSYPDRKLDFLSRYSQLRGGKIAWKPEVKESDPLKIFFLEKEANKTFNKNLLSDREVVDHLKVKWPNLVPTGKSGIPFLHGKTPIINNVKIAEGLIDKEHQAEVGMIMVFEGSNVRKGVSKRTKRPYCMLNIVLSDGYSSVECADWNRKKALRYPDNSIVYVKGTLKKGWKATVSINLKEIELIG